MDLVIILLKYYFQNLKLKQIQTQILNENKLLKKQLNFNEIVLFEPINPKNIRFKFWPLNDKGEIKQKYLNDESGF